MNHFSTISEKALVDKEVCRYKPNAAEARGNSRPKANVRSHAVSEVEGWKAYEAINLPQKKKRPKAKSAKRVCQM